MNVFASNNVLFDGVFCRNSDDCTTVYATRMGFHGGCRNVTMQNSTVGRCGASYFYRVAWRCGKK